MRLILTFILLTAAAVDYAAPIRPTGRRALRLSATVSCAVAATEGTIIDRIARSPQFRVMEKPATIEGRRCFKVMIARMADGSRLVTYGPLSLGNFQQPALEKLCWAYNMWGVMNENERAADECEPVKSRWIGEVEAVDGELNRVGYREHVPIKLPNAAQNERDKRVWNDVNLAAEFFASEHSPWRMPNNFRLTKFKEDEYHLRPFMNEGQTGSHDYFDYYETLARELSNVSRALSPLTTCLDRNDLDCALRDFQEAVKLVRDGETPQSHNGMILPYLALAQTEGFSFTDQKNPKRFGELVQDGCVMAKTITRQDMEFFRNALYELSNYVNLSRRATRPSAPEVLYPLIYLLGEEGRGSTTLEFRTSFDNPK